MKCLLFPPFSIIVLLLNGGHNGANNNYICNSKDPLDFLITYYTALLDKLNVKKTTSVIVIMCLQV